MQAPYLVEMRDLYHGRTPMVLRPALDRGGRGDPASSPTRRRRRSCRRAAIPAWSAARSPHHNEIVLSLTRLDRIREVDPTSNTITCEAGVTLQQAREAAAAVDRLYPQLLPSEGTCTIGGNLSTNAGGTAALAYGVARSHVLGIEVVLADGRVLHDLNKLKKDNTGYDLKNLFIGAEGTLGVITAAVLRLVPRPRSVETAFVGVPSPEAALALLAIATEQRRRRRHQLRIDAARGPGNGAAPRRRLPRSAGGAAPWYVLIELSSQATSGLREVLEDVLTQGLDRAWSSTPRSPRASSTAKAFWRIREMFGEAQTPCRRLDQARRLGAGRGRARVPRTRRTPRSSRSSPAPARCRSAISATATSTTT